MQNSTKVLLFSTAIGLLATPSREGVAVFATICVGVFLVCLLGGVLGIYSILVVGILAALAVAWLFSGHQREHQARLKQYFGLFVASPGRWLLFLVLFTVVALALAWSTPSASEKQTALPGYVAGQEPGPWTEDEQRYYNLDKYGLWSTDAEIRASEQRGDATRFEPRPPRPPLSSDEPFWTRWLSALLLLALTVGYVPFAFADELRRLIPHHHEPGPTTENEKQFDQKRSERFTDVRDELLEEFELATEKDIQTKNLYKKLRHRILTDETLTAEEREHLLDRLTHRFSEKARALGITDIYDEGF